MTHPDAPYIDDPIDDLGRTAVRGAVWSGVQTWGANLLGFAVFVVLGRLLDPGDFGLVAAAWSIVLLLRVIVDAGFGRALVQRRVLDAAHIDTAFWTSVGLGVAFAAATAAVAPLVADVFSQPRLTGIVRALSPIFVLAGLDSTQSALLDRSLQFRVQAIRRLAAAITSGAVAIVLALAGAGVWALVAQQLVLEGVTVVVLWSLASWRPSFRFSRGCFGELLTFGGHYSGIRLLWYLTGNADNVLVGAVLGPVQLGYYAVGYRIFVVLSELLISTINRVAFAALSRLQEDLLELNAAFERASRASAMLALPAFVAVAELARPLVDLLFGPKWGPSAGVLQALCLAGVVQSQAAFASNYALALGRVRNELAWNVLVVAAVVAGFAIAVPYGIVPVALSLGIATSVFWPLRLLFFRRWTGLSLRRYYLDQPQLLAAAAAMAATIEVVRRAVQGNHPAVVVLAGGAAGLLAYCIAVRVLAPAVARDVLALVGGSLRRAAPVQEPSDPVS